MKFRDPMSWSVVLGAGILASIAALPQARGELVLDNNSAKIAEERESMHQALSAPQKAQVTTTTAAAETNAAPAQIAPAPAAATVTTVQVQAAPAPAPAPVAAPAPAPAPAPQAAPVTTSSEDEKLTKSQLMRREREREEVKNEDALQERLEELRLRDEKKRTDAILAPAPTGMPAPTGATQMTPAPTAAAAPVTEEVIVAPTGGAPLKAAPAASAKDEEEAPGYVGGKVEESRSMVYVQPRVGVSSLTGSNYYEVKGHYAAGIGLGVNVSPNVSFELGYDYSEFGVALASNDPYVRWAQGGGYQYYAGYPGYQASNNNIDTLTMKRNTFDANLKLFFTDSDTRIRPFIGAGAGYGRSYINLSDTIQQRLRAAGVYNNQGDYELSQFLGTLSGGLDVKVSKNISIGATFKYYAVLSASENQRLNYGWFGGGYPYYYSAANAGNTDKNAVGDSLTKTGFYSIMGGATFSF